MNNEAEVLRRHSVAVVARRNDGSIAAVRNTKHGGSIELPGGKVEPGESYADAARRELREEAGVEALGLFWLGDFHHDFDSVPWCAHVYVAEIGGQELREGDAGPVCWATWEDLMFGTYGSVVRDIFKRYYAPVDDIAAEVGERFRGSWHEAKLIRGLCMYLGMGPRAAGEVMCAPHPILDIVHNRLCVLPNGVPKAVDPTAPDVGLPSPGTTPKTAREGIDAVIALVLSQADADKRTAAMEQAEGDVEHAIIARERARFMAMVAKGIERNFRHVTADGSAS